jgi:hypothetical protein
MTPPIDAAQDREEGSRLVTIAAKPAPIVVDPARTAVLVVDMQNDFGSEEACSIAPASIFR